MDWAHLVFLIIDLTWFLLGLSCLTLAAVFVFRGDAASQADKLLHHLGQSRRGRRALFAAGLCLPALLALYNLARYSVYYLTMDSGLIGNLAWNVAHGYGLTTTLVGNYSYLAIHFAFTVALFAPFLWLWNSLGVLAVAQGLAVGSAPLALFALARKSSPDRLLPWIVLLLGMSHPSFHDLASTILDNSVYAFPCFVWAAYFFETGHNLLGLLAGLIMFSTREQVPFISFGVGLYLIFRARQPARSKGVALMVASAVLWFLEMKFIGAHEGAPCWSHWKDFFHDIGGSPEAILGRILTRPWELVWASIYPPAKLLPVFRILVQAALLPLFSGSYFLPVLTSWIPHQLSDYGGHYQTLKAHYSSFVLGPLLWAMLHGLIRIREKWPGVARRRLTAVFLLVAACGFLSSPRFYDPEIRVIPLTWRSAAPKALAMIPPEAKVWCDGFLVPHLSMRRYIKVLPATLSDCGFKEGLFLPDFVLLSVYWKKFAEPQVPETILKFLNNRGFKVVFRAADLVLLAKPKQGVLPNRSPEAVRITGSLTTP